MEQTSHFARVLAFLEEKGWKYSHCCEDDCGSIDFEYRGVPYHIWEFHDGDEWGVETNIRHGGRSEELTGDYETELLEIMKESDEPDSKGFLPALWKQIYGLLYDISGGDL